MIKKDKLKLLIVKQMQSMTIQIYYSNLKIVNFLAFFEQVKVRILTCYAKRKCSSGPAVLSYHDIQRPLMDPKHRSVWRTKSPETPVL